MENLTCDKSIAEFDAEQIKKGDCMKKENNQKFENDEDTIIGFIGMPMNKKIFADNMKIQLWFDASHMFGDNNEIKDIDFSKDTRKRQLSWIESLQLLFGKLFGGYGLEKDLQAAKQLAENLFEHLKIQKLKFDIKNEEYILCLGQINILLGTIYAYTDEYIKSVYHLFTGAKTYAVQLNQPYSDFMRYIIKKLDKFPKEQVVFEGYGFNNDLPMGYISSGECALQSQTPFEIITELENTNGDIIPAAYGSRGVLGYLIRKGSALTKSSRFSCDIYETYLIDKNYNLKIIKFYFNGYSSLKESRHKIILPKDFFIEKYSVLNNTFDFIKEDTLLKNKCLVCGKNSNGIYCSECESKQKMMITMPIL